MALKPHEKENKFGIDILYQKAKYPSMFTERLYQAWSYQE